jgi:hypothetical protein
VGKIETGAEICDPEKEPLFYVRAVAELSAQVRALPHLL